MTASDMWTIIASGGGAFLIIILGLIKVKPLEISVWTWLFRKLGKAVNGEMLDKIDEINDSVEELKNQFNKHQKMDDEKGMMNKRAQILQFADELHTNVFHSKEHFDEILDVISDYERYCSNHPEFKNTKTPISEKIIKETYEEYLKTGYFEKIYRGIKDEINNNQ